MNHFLHNWKSHGMEVKARCRFEKNHFLVVEADPSTQIPGGCSKDELFRYIQQLEHDFNISFLNRNYVYFWNSQKEEVVPVPLSSVKEYAGTFQNLLVFDTLAASAEQWARNPVNAQNIWVKNFL